MVLEKELMFIRNYYAAYIEKDIEKPLVSGAEIASCLIVITLSLCLINRTLNLFGSQYSQL